MTNGTIHDKVLKAIETGKVKMRPKWQFVLKGAALAVGIVLATLLLLYLVSFIIFVMRESGAWFVPSFGLRGVGAFLRALPLLLVLVSLVFVILLEVLVRRYSFAYGRPLLYSVIVILLSVLFGGFVVARTSLHHGLYLQARQGGLPLAGQLYRGYGMTDERDVAAGIITEINEQKIVLQHPSGEIIEVHITPQTRFPLGTDLAVGDRVVILGDRDDGIIEAFGVRRFGEMMPHQGFMGGFRFYERK